MTAAFDPYRALGVRRDATDAEVKAAHRRLAKRFHPDAGGDHERFLRVQEAYKVLADPLTRREWDLKHAPGPLRADAPGPPRRSRGAGRTTGRESAPPEATEEPRESPPADDPLRRPRSRRAYTWSASEVPWWEEGVSENRRQPGRKRPSRPTSRPNPAASASSSTSAGTPPTPEAPPPEAPPPEAPNAFDVYNRSSGAAWSMAARAYFRRGDQELPRRGQFHYEGTQVVTGARARTAADAEVRRRAAQARNSQRAQGAAARPRSTQASAAGATAQPTSVAASQVQPRDTAAGVSRDARHIHEVRESWRRRTSAAAWPSLGERLLYSVVAWVPIAIVIGFGATAVTGCGVGRLGCPPYFETAQAISIALALGLLVALPKVAYAGAFASVGALFFALGVVALMALFGVDVPLSYEMSILLGVALVLGYVASVAIVVLRPATTRPWNVGTRQ